MFTLPSPFTGSAVDDYGKTRMIRAAVRNKATTDMEVPIGWHALVTNNRPPPSSRS
jgi:hypothetical protein